jgi:hypothetical protein
MKSPFSVIGGTNIELGGSPVNVDKTWAVSGKYVTLLTALPPGTIEVLRAGFWVPMSTGVRVDFAAAFTSLTVRLKQTLIDEINRGYDYNVYPDTYIFSLGVTSDPAPGTTI